MPEPRGKNAIAPPLFSCQKIGFAVRVIHRGLTGLGKKMPELPLISLVKKSIFTCYEI